MEDDYLVITGTRYGIDEINKLPEAIAAYKSVQKTDDHTLAFHGEFGPFSNFHPCHFTINQQPFHCTEQFLQYQKALMFGDSVTANQILQCENAFEAKRLGYHINGFNMKRWANNRYNLCLDGIRAKFQQNNNLIMMLKSNTPKTIVEAKTDKLWGTGIGLHDHQTLNPEKWYSKGLMSTMLMEIQDELRIYKYLRILQWNN